MLFRYHRPSKDFKSEEGAGGNLGFKKHKLSYYSKETLLFAICPYSGNCTGGVALGPGFLNIEKIDIILKLPIFTIIPLYDTCIEDVLKQLRIIQVRGHILNDAMLYAKI